ncbi:hypothetical protein [Paenibacillus methanolicus]|uniref:Uncharacterized protein n=1 Tax=Paenibacillus methanolicus TaxID=582686 RepID=A0A5S5CLX1_9BACL|nr:hypothetical protein [Paenibacillus methanolicus]TYP79857.1 hypothetical protein BCM02_101978 [Paenibacillus methanolicus]
MTNFRRVLLPALVAIVIAAVAAYLYEANRSPAFEEGPIHIRQTVGGLAYDVRLASNRILAGDEIAVDVKITNTGEKPIVYISGSSSCPVHAVVDIAHRATGARLAEKPGAICTADLVASELKPGQTADDRVLLTTSVWRSSGEEPAPLGDYEFAVALPSENENAPARSGVRGELLIVQAGS